MIWPLSGGGEQTKRAKCTSIFQILRYKELVFSTIELYMYKFTYFICHSHVLHNYKTEMIKMEIGALPYNFIRNLN